MNKSILIVYFSRAGHNYVNGSIVDLAVGNTEVAAKMIKELTGGDIFEIKSVKNYSEDYRTCTEEAQAELRANSRPELAENLSGIDRYETIILCYPNWWGTIPMPVWTFLESHNFSGKMILPLCTHEGSGMGQSEDDIRKLCADAEIEKGLSIVGSKVPNAGKNIESWLTKNRIL